MQKFVYYRNTLSYGINQTPKVTRRPAFKDHAVYCAALFVPLCAFLTIISVNDAAGETVAFLGSKVETAKQKKSSQPFNDTTRASSCESKLGVHRTIKVSRKDNFLVGAEIPAELGLKPREIVLTFDDGPRRGITEAILDALAQECVLATFFAVGRAAREAPDLLVRTARAGHTIGTHSQSHPLLTKQDDAGVRAEVHRGIVSAKWALNGSGYQVSNFFRYPFLDRSLRTDAVIESFGLVGIHINIDSWDWKDQTPEQLLETTLRRTRDEGSGIVLFHDIQHKTAAILPAYLRALHEEGYKIVHLEPADSFETLPQLVTSASAGTLSSEETYYERVSNLKDDDLHKDGETGQGVRHFPSKKTKSRHSIDRFGSRKDKPPPVTLLPPLPQTRTIASAEPLAIKPVRGLARHGKRTGKRKKRLRLLRKLFNTRAGR